MVLLLVSLYLQISPIVPAAAGVVLVVSTIALYIKYREFTPSATEPAHLVLRPVDVRQSAPHAGMRYYYSQHETLTDEYALVFLFGFLFFTYMAYRTLSRSMVVGNKRVRVKR